MDAALALDELEHYCCGGIRNGCFELLDVVIVNILKAGNIGSESFPELLLTRSRDRAHGPSVERHVGSDDLVAVLSLVVEITASELDGSFVCLGAGVTEEHLIGKAQTAQLICELASSRDIIIVTAVDEACGLLGYCLNEGSVAVT